MKKSLFLIGIVFLFNIKALNINEAVNIALKNNNEVKQKAYEYDISKENIMLNKSKLNPKLDLLYEYKQQDKVVPTGSKKNSSASINLSYNLFRGFSDVNLIKSSIYDAQSSNLYLKAFKEDIVYLTKEAYINYLNSKQNKKSYEIAYELFKKQYIDSKNRFEQGFIAKNVLLDLHVKMLIAKQNLIKALSDLKIAKFKLSNILGRVNLDNITIEDLDENKIITKNYNKKYLENRSEIKALKKSLESIKYKIKAQKSEFLPSIDASVSYNKYGDNILLKDAKLEAQGIASIKFSWNLYKGGSKNTQIDINRLKLQQLEQKLQKTRLDIQLQYKEAISNLEVSSLNLNSTKLALMQAEENYKIVSNKYTQGVVKSTDLTDANYLLTNAKKAYFKAYYGKFLAVAKLDRIFERGIK